VVVEEKISAFFVNFSLFDIIRLTPVPFEGLKSLRTLPIDGRVRDFTSSMFAHVVGSVTCFMKFGVMRNTVGTNLSFSVSSIIIRHHHVIPVT